MAEHRVTLPAEELDQAIARLLEEATERGQRINRAVSGDRAEAARPADVTGIVGERLRSMLEDEIVIAVEPEEGRGIREVEFEHEIVKRALVNLKSSNLKSIAKELKLPITGNLEELATRIAKAYGFNQDEIARLILSREDEPDPEHGHTARLFPTTEADLGVVRERMAVVAGRYIRTGVARWFTFKQVRTVGHNVLVDGQYLAYRAVPDPRPDESRLATSRDQIEVTALIAKDGIEVRGGNTSSAKSAAMAVEWAAAVDLRGYVPLTAASGAASNEVVHGSAAFLLDLLITRLARANFLDINVTVVRFKMNDRESAVSEDRRPALKTVRIEGDYLLDSPDACRLLATYRRPLAELSLRVSLNSMEGKTESVPVKVALENDHVLVAVGFGTNAGVARDVSALVTKAVWSEMQVGSADSDALDTFLSRVRDRANDSETPESATMVTVESSDGTSASR